MEEMSADRTIKSERFFANRECPYFPCHKVEDETRFNCLFCYCPLYFLGNECGGHFKASASGKKSCVDCNFPHNPDNYEVIMEKLKSHPVHL